MKRELIGIDMASPGDLTKVKIKVALVAEIANAVKRLGLTQDDAAKRMGLPQSKVSGVMRGEVENISERKLMDCLNRLGYDIEIKVRPAAQALGQVVLAVA